MRPGGQGIAVKRSEIRIVGTSYRSYGELADGDMIRVPVRPLGTERNDDIGLMNSNLIYDFGHRFDRMRLVQIPIHVIQ